MDSAQLDLLELDDVHDPLDPPLDGPTPPDVVARCRRHPTYVLASCDTCRASYVHLPTPRRAEQ